MLARCAHCRETFSTDRFGVQRCPHCGWEVLLADPATAAGAASPEPAPPAPSAAPERPEPAPDAGWGPPPPGHSPWGHTPPWTEHTGWGPLPPGAVLPPARGHDRGEGESSPFAARGREGFLRGLAHTWRLVLFEPRRFFRFAKMDESSAALLFGILSFSVGTWMSLLYAALAGGAGTSALLQILRRLPPGAIDPDATISLVQRATFRGIVAQAVITPLAGLVGIYLAAAIVHLLLLAVGAGRRGFSATLTILAYAYGAFVLEALPMCGGLVAIAWFVAIAVVGVAEGQRCGMGRAAFAVLGPVVLSCLCLCAGAGLVASHLGSGGLKLPEGTGL
jgi:hypothetical protein